MRAAEYRKRIEKTAEVEVPSGATFTLRRPPLQAWINAGRVPQAFVKFAVGVMVNPERLQDVSEEEFVVGMKFISDAIRYACVSPRLVDGGTGDDELDPTELDPVDYEFLTKWVMAGSPGVPVATKGGETSIEALNRFRQKRPGGGFADDSTDGGEVRAEAELDAGHYG